MAAVHNKDQHIMSAKRERNQGWLSAVMLHLVRFPHAARPFAAFSRRPLMSALHHNALPSAPPSSAPQTTRWSNDAASPQVAARPPPAPKIGIQRPRIRPTKAALTIVSFLLPRQVLTCRAAVDTHRCCPIAHSAEWTNSTADTNWGPE